MDVTTAKDTMCPICGYPDMGFAAYDPAGWASFEICPCCGNQFGYDDASYPIPALRRQWLAAGGAWFSTVVSPPQGWSADRQIADAGLDPDG